MRRHIPIHEVATGSRVFVVPRDSSTPRGPRLEPVPVEGCEVLVDDYVYGCIQRGALLAYGPEEPAAPADEENT